MIRDPLIDQYATAIKLILFSLDDEEKQLRVLESVKRDILKEHDLAMGELCQ